MDTRAWCIKCRQPLPRKNILHACRAEFGQCYHCQAVASKYIPGWKEKLCWKHNWCEYSNCHTILYKRRGYCDAHRCIWKGKLDFGGLRELWRPCFHFPKSRGSFCENHYRWGEARAAIYGRCPGCYKDLHYKYVPFWLKKAGYVSKDVARHLAQFLMRQHCGADACKDARFIALTWGEIAEMFRWYDTRLLKQHHAYRKDLKWIK